MFRAPAAGVPEIVHERAAAPDLPQRYPGMLLARLRSADDADQAAGQEWDGWFADRPQSA